MPFQSSVHHGIDGAEEDGWERCNCKFTGDKELVYTNSFADEKGNILSGPEFGLEYDIPVERLCEITFEPFKEWTRIKLIYRGLPENGHSDWSATEIGKSLTQLSGMIDQHY